MALLACTRIEQDSLFAEAILLPGLFHSLLALMLLEFCCQLSIVLQTPVFIIVAKDLSDREMMLVVNNYVI
jgi:hypothetical protein